MTIIDALSEDHGYLEHLLEVVETCPWNAFRRRRQLCERLEDEVLDYLAAREVNVHAPLLELERTALPVQGLLDDYPLIESRFDLLSSIDPSSPGWSDAFDRLAESVRGTIEGQEAVFDAMLEVMSGPEAREMGWDYREDKPAPQTFNVYRRAG